MRKLFTAILLAGAMFGIQSCEKNDNSDNISRQAQEALAAKYPSASDIHWQIKRGYSVADFRYGSSAEECTAWFDNAGKWYMTKTEIRFEALPEAVKTAFGSSEYATWRVEDVDKLERSGVETVYVIEVEKHENGAETEIDLYYSPDGVLVKTVVDADDDDDYGDCIPPMIESAIEAFIESRYPGARILEIEREDKNMTEVDILDGRTKHELLFDASLNWVRTETEIRRSDIPAAVKAAIAALPQYAGYEIDDADYIETPDGAYYLIELESGKSEVKLRIDAEGNIL